MVHELAVRVSASDRGSPWFAGVNGTAILDRSAYLAGHPVCLRPIHRGADRAQGVKTQRPTGRTVLTLWARSARLCLGALHSAGPGSRRCHRPVKGRRGARARGCEEGRSVLLGGPVDNLNVAQE